MNEEVQAQEISDQTNDQETTQSVEVVETTEFYQHITQSVDNIQNIALFSCVFLGSILGSLLVSLLFKNLKS